MRRQLATAHRAAAAACADGRFVEASRSGHLVPITEPDVVAREIRALLDRPARARTAA